MPVETPSRNGWLVVAALGIVGVCLLVTAVVRVREQAARTTCHNNLKQLSTATYNYASTSKDRTPHLTDQGEGTPTGKGLPSIFFMLTPFLESAPIMYRPGQPPANYLAPSSEKFPFRWKDGGTYEEAGGAANQLFWRSYRDPADDSSKLGLRDVPMALPDGTTGYYATGSYAANGMVPWGRTGPGTTIPELGNVILFAERPQVCRGADGEVTYNLWGVGFYSPHMPAFATLTPAEPPGLWSTGQVAPAVPLPGEGSLLRVRVGRWDAPEQEPDYATPVQVLDRRRPCDPRLPGSPHPSGMQAAMGDGSVRVFSPETTPWVFWSACAPSKP